MDFTFSGGCHSSVSQMMISLIDQSAGEIHRSRNWGPNHPGWKHCGSVIYLFMYLCIYL